MIDKNMLEHLDELGIAFIKLEFCSWISLTPTGQTGLAMQNDRRSVGWGGDRAGHGLTPRIVAEEYITGCYFPNMRLSVKPVWLKKNKFPHCVWSSTNTAYPRFIVCRRCTSRQIYLA
jgi:hypothetical protein